MDHATFDTGQLARLLRRLPAAGDGQRVPALRYRRSVPCLATSRTSAPGPGSSSWIKAAGVRGALRDGRHGLMGHLYPGMLDVSTDLTLVTAQSRAAMWRSLEIRRPAGPGRRRHRCRDRPPGIELARERLRARRHGRRRGLPLGRAGLGRASTGWSRTSRSTRSPTTTAASRASSTSGSAPA